MNTNWPGDRAVERLAASIYGDARSQVRAYRRAMQNDLIETDEDYALLFDALSDDARDLLSAEKQSEYDDARANRAAHIITRDHRCLFVFGSDLDCAAARVRISTTFGYCVHATATPDIQTTDIGGMYRSTDANQTL